MRLCHGDSHRWPDGLHRPGPPTAPADVRVEVQLKPISAGVVDRSTRQAELAAQQPSLGQVEGRDDRENRVVGREEFDEVDRGVGDVETLTDAWRSRPSNFQ